MDFTYLFTSLQGRVSRAKWWVGEAVLFVVFSALALIGNQTPIGPAISALVWIILYLPAYSLAAKRFQDRDKPGEMALYGYVPSIIATGLLSFGPVESDPRTLELPIGDVDVSVNWNTNTLGVICFLILTGVTAWFLIELGMLKGTPGPNRFGPDPLHRTDVKMQPMSHASG
jgi:uncharacterized membrane protein YhaH (DUF805 family)